MRPWAPRLAAQTCDVPADEPLYCSVDVKVDSALLTPNPRILMIPPLITLVILSGAFASHAVAATAADLIGTWNVEADATWS